MRNDQSRDPSFAKDGRTCGKTAAKSRLSLATKHKSVKHWLADDLPRPNYESHMRLMLPAMTFPFRWRNPVSMHRRSRSVSGAQVY